MKIAVLALITIFCVHFALSANECHSSCGSQSALGCSDYTAGTKLADQCYTCAFGYVGGGGDGVQTGRCTKGTCHTACKSCADTTNQRCYVCSPGYFDPIGNPAVGSPCNICHESCYTCQATSGSGSLAVSSADGCLTCAAGWFDSNENPNSASACTKCSAECSTCRFASDKCTACPQGKYSTDEFNGGRCIELPGSGMKIIFALSSLIIMFLLFLI